MFQELVELKENNMSLGMCACWLIYSMLWTVRLVYVVHKTVGSGCMLFAC